MISKRRKLTAAQQLALATIDAAETLAKLTPAILSLGAVALVAMFVQKEINKKVEIDCPKSISVIVEHPTAVGPSYQCVSRAQLKGPAPALKP